MFFVTNQHILVKFRGGKTVIYKSNGTIIRQYKRIQEILDKENSYFPSKSVVEYGRKFLLVKNNDEKIAVVYKFVDCCSLQICDERKSRKSWSF